MIQELHLQNVKSTKRGYTMKKSTLQTISSIGILTLLIAVPAAYAKDVVTKKTLVTNTKTVAPLSDSALTAQINKQLLANKDTKTSTFDVTTSKGLVTLSGTVGSSAVRLTAIAVAKGVAGVKDVDADDLLISDDGE